MSDMPLLAGTIRPKSLVNRVEQLNTIREALERPGDETRVIIIKGAGGLGKTRLVEEILLLLGDPDLAKQYRPKNSWEDLKSTLTATKLLDLYDINLHSAVYLRERLGQASTWHGKLNFRAFEQAQALWRRVTDHGAAFSLTEKAEKAAEAAFWKDYQAAAEKRRLLIALDTAEQFAITPSEWMLEHEILSSEDVTAQAGQWLIQSIAAGQFKNSSLIFSGRGKEGKRFLKSLREQIDYTDHQVELIPVTIAEFDIYETKQFFAALQNDLESESQTTTGHIQEILTLLNSDDDKLAVLHTYTGGQPVRLSLYSDLLLEGHKIPEPLQKSYQEVKHLTESGNLDNARLEIEKELSRLLFAPRPGVQAGLRSQIMQALVRTPRGLSAEEIHFYIDSKPDQRAVKWKADPDRKKKIEKVLKSLHVLSIIKPKPGGRTGVQDEVYRIYDESMLEGSAHEQEKKERNRLYKCLGEFADARQKQLRKKQVQLIEQELKQTHVDFADILATRLPMRTLLEERRYHAIATELLDAKLTQLNYALRIDPSEAYNETYHDLTGALREAYDLTNYTLLEIETWRTLTSKHSLAFSQWERQGQAEHKEENLKKILLRAAKADNAASWIMRYWISKNYKRAIKLAGDIEKKVAAMPGGLEKSAWNHTLSQAGRTCWAEMARIYQGGDVRSAIDTLENLIPNLEKLHDAPKEKRINIDGREEYGFVGHPARYKLIYTLVRILNSLGYGQVNMGQDREAVKSFTKALKFARELPATDPPSSEKATIRNNLARALVETGKRRSIRICRDALNLRIRHGAMIPIGMSYNTLALIYNDLYQPDKAAEYGALALAIGRFAEDSRLTGLALLQIGEALRRQVSLDPLERPQVEATLNQAEKALRQAWDIFKGGARGEFVRLVETYLELGCIYRDWIRHINPQQLPVEWRKYRDGALEHLSLAIKDANENGFARLELDAQVNLGWYYYYANQPVGAEEALKEAESIISDEGKLRPNSAPPSYEANQSYFFKQLSRIHSLRGKMAMERFETMMRDLKPKSDRAKRSRLMETDESVRAPLREGATNYVLALSYSRLFANRSVMLGTIYDDLYAFLKKLNADELSHFYRFEEEARQLYGTDEIVPENLGDIKGFLEDTFGNFWAGKEIESNVPETVLE